MSYQIRCYYRRWLDAERARRRRLEAARERSSRRRRARRYERNYTSEKILTARLGWFVGAGASPREAAFLNDVLRGELVRLRVQYHDDYDAGLYGGRCKLTPAWADR